MYEILNIVYGKQFMSTNSLTLNEKSRVMVLQNYKFVLHFILCIVHKSQAIYN